MVHVFATDEEKPRYCMTMDDADRGPLFQLRSLDGFALLVKNIRYLGFNYSVPEKLKKRGKYRPLNEDEKTEFRKELKI